MNSDALDAIVQNLSPKLIASLGTKPDTVLAAEFEVSVKIVKLARKTKNIPRTTYTQGLLNNPEFMSLVGKAPDTSLDIKFNCPGGTVLRTRTILGLPAFVQEPTQELIDALGTMPDSDIASKLGFALSFVQNVRRRLSIPAGNHTNLLASNEEFLSSLGELSDEEVAFKFRCSSNFVAKRRRILSIPSKHNHSVSVGAAWQAKYLQEVIPLLGTMPDAELARLYGGLTSRYRHLRLKEGIQAFQPEPDVAAVKAPKQVPQPKAERKLSRRSRTKPTYTLPDGVIELLGTMNDRLLSEETGAPYEHIRHYRAWLKIPPARSKVFIPQELIDSLGKMKDEDVAEKFGRPHIWVRKERNKRGIPPFYLYSIPGVVESLGKMTDFEVASKYDVSLGWVRRARQQRGIPCFKPKKGAKLSE
ncbi:hypothetical protein [Pseudomonas sp. UBA7530]|uniref:hypothetical protein n=1 Tax=Pseudomonas sp. UBA7530 TaxID=1947341 RepID=UPI0025DD1A85|nr:hypothetical protein [Pseudomonas sp. UBA7530]